ncbi:hypothetical protein WN48_00778 [Eufriesea mexicana]|uniref:Uncharacterized protein n=1 Tax=Eufriesea mexicana TaxID=516756 RepID=A0A310SD27_9HYME|nr:hypothetical protein WN48_00778 [Eufriesea mexicana]
MDRAEQLPSNGRNGPRCRIKARGASTCSFGGEVTLEILRELLFDMPRRGRSVFSDHHRVASFELGLTHLHTIENPPVSVQSTGRRETLIVDPREDGGDIGEISPKRYRARETDGPGRKLKLRITGLSAATFPDERRGSTQACEPCPTDEDHARFERRRTRPTRSSGSDQRSVPSSSYDGTDDVKLRGISC